MSIFSDCVILTRAIGVYVSECIGVFFYPNKCVISLVRAAQGIGERGRACYKAPASVWQGGGACIKR